jgi:hypothetical protein
MKKTYTIFRETDYGDSDIVKTYDNLDEAEKELIKLIGSSDKTEFTEFVLTINDK